MVFTYKLFLRSIALAFFLCICSCGHCIEPEQESKEPESKEPEYGPFIGPYTQFFIPGECLKSSELIYFAFSSAEWMISNLIHIGQIDPSVLPEDIDYNSVTLIFGLKMDIDIHRTLYDNNSVIWFMPSYSLFEEFGNNADAVANNYNNVYDVIGLPYTHPYDYTAVLYDKNNFTLTADRDFAGIPAGQNLRDIAYIGNEIYDYRLSVPGIEYQDNTFALDYNIYIIIPIESDPLGTEATTFSFSIPVKVGMYLHWLNDRLTDPDAQMQYRDETLTCTFTVHKDLQ